MQRKKLDPWRNPEYLKFVRDRPCMSCGTKNMVQSHHEDEGFHNKGMGIKAPDSQTAPLCYECHWTIDDLKIEDDTLNKKMISFMIVNLSRWIDKQYNVSPDILIVNLLTDYIKGREEDDKEQMIAAFKELSIGDKFHVAFIDDWLLLLDLWWVVALFLALCFFGLRRKYE